LQHEGLHRATNNGRSLWRIKGEHGNLASVEVKSCRVTISDLQGVAHTVEVTATTLYEAIALGLKQIRGHEWAEDLAGAMNPVTVRVKSIEVEHTIRLGDFTKWLERKGGSPAETMRRRRIKDILGMPT
jgi:hypothetical protein